MEKPFKVCLGHEDDQRARTCLYESISTGPLPTGCLIYIWNTDSYRTTSNYKEASQSIINIHNHNKKLLRPSYL